MKGSQSQSSQDKKQTHHQKVFEQAGCDEDDTNYSPAKETQIILCQVASSFCETRGQIEGILLIDFRHATRMGIDCCTSNLVGEKEDMRCNQIWVCLKSEMNPEHNLGMMVCTDPTVTTLNKM